MFPINSAILLRLYVRWEKLKNVLTFQVNFLLIMLKTTTKFPGIDLLSFIVISQKFQLE